MERLLLVLMGLSCAACYGQDFCSLTVLVRDRQARPVDTWVSVTLATGHTLRELTSDLGIASFCDLGVKPVTIHVGSGGCNELTLRNVHLLWKRGKEVQLIYEPCYYEHGDLPPSQGCRVMVRAVDSTGRPLAHSRVVLGMSRSISQSDNFGRVFFQVSARSMIEGSLSHPSATMASFSIRCEDSELIEETIALRN